MMAAHMDLQRAQAPVEQALRDIASGDRDAAAQALRIASDRLGAHPTAADCAARFHPANVASRERSMRVLNLALHLADACVRSVIARPMTLVIIDGEHWFNPQEARGGNFPDVDKALQYIELRDPDAFPWRFVRHPEQPHLVRFEDKP